MKTLFGINIAVFLLFVQPVGWAGQDEDLDAFNEAYSQYETLYSQGELSQSVQQARIAYEIGGRLFGKDSEDFAALAFNYAYNLSQLGNFEEAIPVYSDSLEATEAVHGKESMQLAPALMALGHANAFIGKKKSMRQSFGRTLKLAEKNHGKGSAEYGWYSVKAGIDILNVADDRSGERYLRRGYEALQSSLGDEHVRTGFAAFHLGSYEMGEEDFESARDLLLLALESFENPEEPSNKFELSTHAFLVETYEGLGQSEEATRHCLAIGRMTPFQSTQDYFPIYKKPPVYPLKALNRNAEGYAIVKFTVDESGIVRNPELVETEGHKEFGKAALAAAEKFRYAPRFRDGSPVKVENVQNRVNFQLQHTSRHRVE